MQRPSSIDIRYILPMRTSTVEVIFTKLKNAKVNLSLINFTFRALF